MFIGNKSFLGQVQLRMPGLGQTSAECESWKRVAKFFQQKMDEIASYIASVNQSAKKDLADGNTAGVNEWSELAKKGSEIWEDFRKQRDDAISKAKACEPKPVPGYTGGLSPALPPISVDVIEAIYDGPRPDPKPTPAPPRVPVPTPTTPSAYRGGPIPAPPPLPSGVEALNESLTPTFTPTPSRPRNIPQGSYEPTPTPPTTFREQGLAPSCPEGQLPMYPGGPCREGVATGGGSLVNTALTMGPASVMPGALSPMSNVATSFVGMGRRFPLGNV